MSPLVAVDVDETVADLLGEWLRRYNERSGDNILPEDITGWTIAEQLREGWQDRKALDEILLEPDLYRHVLPIPFARRAVRRLRDAGCRVVFASSCPPGQEHHKIAWLMRYGLITDAKEFISAKDKSLVRADILIDDGPHNVRAFLGRSFLVSQPHNLGCDPIPGTTRVGHIAEAVNIILGENYSLGI